MLINPRLSSDISKVLVITIFYVLINIFMSLYNDSLFNSAYVVGTTELYDSATAWFTNIFTGIIAGVLGGSALVIVNGSYFRRKSFNYAMRTTFFVYVIVFLIVLFLGSFASVYSLNEGLITFNDYLEGFSFFAFSKMALVYFLFWGIVTLFTLFFLQINDKFGPGMFFKFLAGKYYQPREEDRIFMFLDLKSSTSIAEKIGSKRYFNLLNDIFKDVTNSILISGGQIYQYVGDEVVISWELSKGLDRANCIHCFTRIRNKLLSRDQYYQNTYGLHPYFKAGLHLGKVTVGEIGSIKRDIVYSGDVLNTTSRIQEQCKHYEVDFLVSTDTLDALKTNVPYKAIPLGNIALRGKKNSVELNTLEFEKSA